VNFDRIIQIKLVKVDEPPKPNTGAPQISIESPKSPFEKPEAIVEDLMYKTAATVVIAYSICKAVDFFFSMNEAMLVKKWGL
jgi:hypothetical protein